MAGLFSFPMHPVSNMDKYLCSPCTSHEHWEKVISNQIFLGEAAKLRGVEMGGSKPPNGRTEKRKAGILKVLFKNNMGKGRTVFPLFF